MPTTAEQAIYNRLASAPTFHPATAELLLNDWALEPGDVVTVKSGENNYSLPIYSLNLNWTGSDLKGTSAASTTRIAIESTGHKEREPLPELRRKQFEQGRYAYTGFKAQQQEIDEHWQHVTTVTDQGMSDAFGIIGVSIGADGKPVKDANGNYVWDDSGTGGEIWGHLNRSAWTSVIQNHIQDANGNILSIGQVLTSADGQALITAINDQRTGTAQIRADRIKIDSTSGSSFSIENDGTMTFNAENAIAAINAATAEINADKIQLTSSGTAVTLDDKFEIDTDGYINLKGTTIVQGDLNLTQNYGVSARNYTVGTGGYIRLIGSNTGEYYDLDTSNMPECIRDLQFVVDPNNSGHYILQKKTIYNSATWTDAANFNIAATQFYIDGVAAADQAGYDRAANQRTTLTATSNGTYTPTFGYSSVVVNVPSSSIVVNDIQLNAASYQQGTQSQTGVTTSLGYNSDGSDPVRIFSNTVFQLDHWYCFKITVNGVSKGYYFKASS